MFKVEFKKYKTRKNTDVKRAVLVTIRNPFLKENISQISLFFKDLLDKKWDTIIFILNDLNQENENEVLNPYLLKILLAIHFSLKKPLGIVAGERAKRILTLAGLRDLTVIRNNLQNVLLGIEGEP